MRVRVKDITQTFEQESVQLIYNSLVGKHGELTGDWIVEKDANYYGVNIDGDEFWLKDDELELTNR